MDIAIIEVEDCPFCGPNCICDEVEAQYGCMQTESVILTENGPRFYSEVFGERNDDDDKFEDL